MEIPLNLIVMQLTSGLALGALYVLMASGLSIILGLMDVINFAHGIFYMLSAYAVFTFIALGGNFWVGAIAGIIIISLIGAVFEYIFLKPLYKKGVFYPLFMTFGLSVCIPDLIQMVYGLVGKSIDYPKMLQGVIEIGPFYLSKYRLFIIVLTICVVLLLYLFLKKSSLGMVIRASTRDNLMVNILGINSSRIWTIGFSIGVGMAALAGALAAPMVAVNPHMGVSMTIESFVVVVVGGLGSLAGAILGGLLIGMTISFSALFFPGYSAVAIYMVMAIILLFRPRGLLGEEGRS